MPEEMKSKADELFELLKNEELSEEQKKAVETILKENSTILFDKEFVEKLAMPDLLSLHEKEKDINALIEANEQGLKNVRQVLKNLKSFEVDGQNAASYVLEKGYLPNGELIGTQAIKNMHFLGTAKRESGTPEINRALEHQGYFLMELYEGEYPHNKNARNMTGQKASDLLGICIDQNKYEDKRVNKNDDALETLHNQSFMKNMSYNKVEEQRKSMTAESIQERIYRGTASVEDKALYQKLQDEKKEADMEDVDGDKRSYGDRKGGEKFKEEDVIKYMYEEWFLALMSWGFDKVEDGVEILLGEGIERGRKLFNKHKNEASKEPDPKLKAAKEEVASFEEAVSNMKEALKADCMTEITDVQGQTRELMEGYNDPEKEEALKAKYGADTLAIIRKQKDPVAYLQMAEQGWTSKALMETRMRFAAMDLTKIEMVDEMMRSDKRWRNPDGSYKTLEQLMSDKEFGERVENRLSKIMEAWDTLSVDIPLRAEAEFNVLTDKQKEKFVQKNILGAYDQLIKDPNLDDATKEHFKQAKESFKKQYEAFDKEGAQENKEQLIFTTYANLKKMEYLKELEDLALKAQKQQDKDFSNGKFDVIGLNPNVSTKDTIEKADGRTKEIIEQGMNDAKIFDQDHVNEEITAKMDLREALKKHNEPTMSDVMQHYYSEKTRSVSDGREHVAERKKYMQECKAKIDAQNKQKRQEKLNSTLQPYVDAMSYTKGY